MTGREGPGPERPGPDYPPEWDTEPAWPDEHEHDRVHRSYHPDCTDCDQRADQIEAG